MFQQNPEVLDHSCQVWTDHVFAGEALVPAGRAANHYLDDRGLQEVNMYHVPSNVSINYTFFPNNNVNVVNDLMHCCCIWFKTAVIPLEAYSSPCFSSHVKP